MPLPDTSSSKPDIQTPNVEGMRNERRDELGNDERMAPKAPKMSGGSAPDPNPLNVPPDMRDAGEPEQPMGDQEPRTGR